MTLTFTDDNGTQTPIDAKPDSLNAETTHDGNVRLTVSWDRDDLAVNDPDGYKGLAAAFPSHGALTLDVEGDQQPPQNPGTPGEPQPLPAESLFHGSVTAVGHCGRTLRLSAVSDNGGSEPGSEEPVITVTPNVSDASGLTVDITVDNKGQGPGSLDLGDGSPAQDNPGDGTTVTSHAYAVAGAYTVVFTDADEASRTASAAVTIPATA